METKELENYLTLFTTDGYQQLVENWEEQEKNFVEAIVQETDEKRADFLRGCVAAIRANINFEQGVRLIIEQEEDEHETV